MNSASPPILEQDHAVVFIDLAGSTSLYNELGNAVAFQIVRSALDSIGVLVRNSSGRIVKEIGDEVLCVFESLHACVSAMIALQQSFFLLRVDSSRVPRLRISLAFGAVIASDHDVHGDAVNVASRLNKYAKPGEIVAAKSDIRRFHDGSSFRFRFKGAAYLKGKPGITDVYLIKWDSSE